MHLFAKLYGLANRGRPSSDNERKVGISRIVESSLDRAHRGGSFLVRQMGRLAVGSLDDKTCHARFRQPALVSSAKTINVAYLTA
jgi:hypothetical protein